MSAPTITESKRRKGQERPRIVAIRVTDEERDTLIERARSAGKSVSEYLRALALTQH